MDSKFFNCSMLVWVAIAVHFGGIIAIGFMVVMWGQIALMMQGERFDDWVVRNEQLLYGLDVVGDGRY